MSTLVRSAIVVAALLGSVSTASATYYGYGHGYGHGYSKGYGHGHWHGYGKRWVKVHGKWQKHDVRAFFEHLRKNNGN